MSEKAASKSERQPRPPSTLNHVSAGDWRQELKCISADDEKRHRRHDLAGIRDEVLKGEVSELVEGMLAKASANTTHNGGVFPGVRMTEATTIASAMAVTNRSRLSAGSLAAKGWQACV
jgi:hypothetical protein